MLVEVKLLILASKYNGTVLTDLVMAKMLQTRMNSLTGRAMIRSKRFVNDTFVAARETYTEKRKDEYERYTAYEIKRERRSGVLVNCV